MNRAARRKYASTARVPRHRPVIVSAADVRDMHAVEAFVLGYAGDDLAHEIERTFPGISYRAVFLAIRRARDPARWFQTKGHA